MDVERAIEVMVENQARFEANQAKFDANQARFDANQAKFEANLKAAQKRQDAADARAAERDKKVDRQIQALMLIAKVGLKAIADLRESQKETAKELKAFIAAVNRQSQNGKTSA